MTDNPYPKMITDESSGVEVSNPLYEAWAAGWETGYWDCMCDIMPAWIGACSSKSPWQNR